MWVKVDREQCCKDTDKPHIKLRWVDVNKGDGKQPKHRSRIVAKDIKTNNRPDLFAATPPIEHVKYLVSRLASSQRGRSPTRLMVQDVKKGDFLANATRKIYVELPPEEDEHGKVGLLLKSLYGTRDAALIWTACYTSVLTDKLGFNQGQSTPCAFYHDEWKIRTVVHGKDFVSEGPLTNLKKMDAMLGKHFDIKTEFLGPESEPECVQRLTILNRVVTWEAGGVTWEPDPRRAEIIINQLWLTGAKPLKLPGAKEPTRKDKASIEDLEEEVASIFAAQHSQVNGIDDGDKDDIQQGSDDAFISEDDRTAQLESDGWMHTGDNLWIKAFHMASSLPMPDVKGVKRRIVWDSVNGVLMDDLWMGKKVKPSRTKRSLRRRRDITVELELGEVSATEEKSWEEQEMEPTDATLYRAVVARCNLLSVDRPDVMFASKECSRCMARPVNGDWEPIKRLGRYLISRPRVVHVFKWQDEPTYLSAFSDSN